MKRSADDLRRLIRAQQTMADLARVEHRTASIAAEGKTAEIEALELWSERLDAHELPLLDIAIEKQRTLAAERVTLGRKQEAARERLAGETARCRPLERAYLEAMKTEARIEQERQLSELLDRQAARPNQGSRKPRQP